jgi:uncharacterized protein (DUF362 family)
VTSKRIYINRCGEQEKLDETVLSALSFLNWEDLIPRDARVFIKPNLTWKTPLPGVTTTPAFIEASVKVLKERTRHVIIGESDGGYHGFRAEEAFESHGLYELSRRYNVQVVNLSDCDTETVRGSIAGKTVEVDLPKLLLRDIDVFITIPVPKVHATTRVSLAFKNQWGCIPSPMRLHHHAEFARKILLINQALRTSIALFDATYMLDRSGPMIGEPVPAGLILASDDPGVGSLACCRLMGIDPWSVPHLRMARSEGMAPLNLTGIETNQPLEPFCTRQFRLKRNLMSWAALAAFRSEFLTRMMYDSMFADLSHRVLYSARKHHMVSRILYGALGPPEIEGRRTKA